VEPGTLDDTLRGVGVRLDWSEVPVDVRRGIEHMLGADVVQAESRRGGFSPGVAARLRLSDDRRLFIKAAGIETNPDAPEIHRREALVASRLPESVPMPRFVASYDHDGWVALVFEDVHGGPPQLPWRRTELERVVGAVNDLARSLTPSPVMLPPITDKTNSFAGFQELRALKADGDTLDDVDPWVVRHLDRLAALHDYWSEATEGHTLLHLDIRADNVLLTSERVLFVDWPWATVGASWIDLLFMLPSVAMQGGPQPWCVFDEHELSRQASAESVTVALAGLTGMFISRGRRPDPPALPTLRRFQRAQGIEGVRWLQRRTAWR